MTSRTGTLAGDLRLNPWMHFPSLDSRVVRTAIACAAMVFAAAARAAGAGFSEGLSAEERAACGITKLAPAQVAALNVLVAHDVTLARQGGVTGFSSAFLARHSAQDRATAGIGLLSEGERSALDSLAARAIAMGPPPSQGFAYAPPAAPASDVLVSAPLRPEIHGDVSFTVGGGSHGSSFYGSSADLFVTDPTGRFTVGVGVSEYRGRGFFGPFGLCDPAYAGPYAPGF
jgi:hypothetical protein